MYKAFWDLPGGPFAVVLSVLLILSVVILSRQLWKLNREVLADEKIFYHSRSDLWGNFRSLEHNLILMRKRIDLLEKANVADPDRVDYFRNKISHYRKDMRLDLLRRWRDRYVRNEDDVRALDFLITEYKKEKSE